METAVSESIIELIKTLAWLTFGCCALPFVFGLIVLAGSALIAFIDEWRSDRKRAQRK
jgi:hypothetical protein